jgi:vitamin B12 transporter
MSHCLLLLSIGAIAAPAVASAQGATPVGEVVVTASRLPTTAGTTPYSVAVVPEADLAVRESVADALTGLADIYVQAPGGRSGFASMFLRGSDPNFTVMLLDGVPLNNPTNTRGGSVNVSELGAAGLERIEVVTGPLSSLYGSGGLAGVVNLVVPGGSADHRVRTTLGVGTQDDYSASALWRGPLSGGYGGSLAISLDDDGDATPGSSFSSRSLTGKIAPIDQVDAGRVVFRLASTDSRAFPDSSGGYRLAVNRDLEYRESREALIGANYPIFKGDGFRFDLSGSFLTRRDETASPGVAPSAMDPFGIPAGEDDTRYRRGIVDAVARFEADAWSAAAGLEAQREEARSEGELDFGFPVPSGFKGDRSTYSGFVEASHTTSQWVLNAGARVDRIDGLGSNATARAGARYNIPGTGFSLRAAVGTGFKAPSFYALGNPFVGNPDLRPEKSRAGEVGLLWTGNGGDTFAVTAFYTRFAGLIDFVPGPPPRLENRSIVISKGASVALTKSFSDRLMGSLQVQYADTRDEETDTRLLNRPHWRATSSLAWKPVDDVTITGRHSFVSGRDDYSTPTGPSSLSGYQTISLDAAWDVQSEMTVRLIVDNALDDDHEDAIGFPSPGRRARILLSREF